MTDWPAVAAIVSVGIAICSFGWRILYKLDRFLVLFDEYPPHKHIDSKILYPKGMDPDAHVR